MITEEVLLQRAIKYACEQQNITADSIQRFPSEVLNKFQLYVESIRDDMRYNQLKYFKPFDYQREFYATGSRCDRRGILAANRVGKTVSTCYEAAYHLTGRYPDWWVGKRFNKPVTLFAAGEGWDQVARVLQEELLGTNDSKLTQQIGSGAIPRDCIVFDTMRSDGANIINLEVRHRSGQRSRLMFGNYTQEVRNLQGFKLDLCILDEQPPDDFFSELVTRTATTQGQVLCSFTPLKGLNGLVKKFWDREQGYEFIRVSWHDVPEYDLWGQPFLLKSTREQLARDFMPYEREARIEGKPVMGHGAIFPLKTWPTYSSKTFNPQDINNVERIIALDLGLVNDATVISLMYWDPRERMAYLHKQIVIGGRDRKMTGDAMIDNLEEANPTSYVQHLLQPAVFGCPIVLPADASTQGRYTMSTLSIRELFESYGLNVHNKPIMNPPDSEGRVTNLKSYGINVMRQMLEAGSFMINENCDKFISQAANYFVDEKGRYSDPDDCIDSARYALLGCLQELSEPADRPANQKMIQARNTILSIQRQRELARPANKQPKDPNFN